MKLDYKILKWRRTGIRIGINDKKISKQWSKRMIISAVHW